MTYHVPVMSHEVIEGLQVRPDGRYIDATVGGGGHAKAIVDMGATVLGIDTDREAIEEARKIDTKKLTIIQGNFSDIVSIAKAEGFTDVDGILFDLGVSSHQLDDPKRGFSYRFAESNLDMRLDQGQEKTAYDVLAYESQENLTTIIETFGEEEHGGDISRAIVRARQIKPIKTSADLLAIINTITKGIDANKTASRVYQAIRIYTNNELEALKNGLRGGMELLKPGGRMAVISFHSLEDRIVKQFFQKETMTLVNKKPITAKYDEQKENKRSRSAKLRIAIKI